MYDDGDIDEGLELRCLRPYRPYQIGEGVQVRKSEEEWFPGTIIAIYRSEDSADEGYREGVLLFDVQLDEDNMVLAGMRTDVIRRYFDNARFNKGDHVDVEHEND